MKRVRLSRYVVARVRPVPPHVYQQFDAVARGVLDSPPARPTAQRTSKITGHTEEFAALPGTPEYDAWEKETEAWMVVAQSKEAEKQAKWNSLLCNFSLVEWRIRPDRGFGKLWHAIERLFGGGWQNDAPSSWEYPQALRDAGLEPGNRRMDYIGIVVIQNPVALNVVLTTAMDITSDLDEKEVEAALGGFLAATGRRATDGE